MRAKLKKEKEYTRKDVEGKNIGENHQEVVRKKSSGKRQKRNIRIEQNRKKYNRTSGRRNNKTEKKLLSFRRRSLCFFLTKSASHSQSL